MSRNKLLSIKNTFEACGETALKAAKKLGAHEAEISVAQNTGLTVSIRQHEIDTLEHQQDKGLVVTVYVDHCKGSASTSDFSDKAIKEAVNVAVDIARFTSKDEFSGLPAKDDIAWDYPSLDLYHPWEISAEDATELARECEVSALKFDKRITNSEGATLSSHDKVKLYANSHGFTGFYPSSSHSLSCSVIASDNEAMQRDHWHTISREPTFLQTPKEVGRYAAKRAVSRLNARQIPTGKYPVLFSPEMASGLIGHLVSALSGGNVYRKSSFLLDALETKIFPDWIHIYEQPHIMGAIGSAPFDSEGVKTTSRNIVTDGILRSFFLDSYSAKKLKMQSTGNAGGVHNLFVESGSLNLSGMLKKMDRGLFVTELMGQGINIVTGNYSRGAAGFWVENGKIQYPVEEITIADNLSSMFQNIISVGNDVDTRRNIRTGSILIEKMMVAGK